MEALERFGLPKHIVDMITAIYEKLYFEVKAKERNSTIREQKSGIAQNCPLSPYLFIMCMIILLEETSFRKGNCDMKEYIVSSDLVYADDTMVIATQRQNA